ncbi:MAG: type 1 glutamine amidotransferase [Rhodospirillum sp.]|nr:type 1 glutamine amidotransferase [Rhodospirillum sp.]MCF8489105.1 type 1 glutamine amidotransferase [Rhodospirillum sp.]MCF8498895.1 type 1 glutamine amidotransferase [Rhodospirillum sp.]
MTQAPLFLIVEGNTAPHCAVMADYGAQPYARAYGQILTEMWPGARWISVHPADGPPSLPPGVSMAEIDGVVITGSALNLPNGGPEVERQVDLVRDLLAQGAPLFGSCWGLQVAAVAAGGTVRESPRGREVGVARKITATAAGAHHPLLTARAGAWDALAIHRDEVGHPPEGALILATNGHSPVQAMEIRGSGGVFWGVQYHPEFDLPEMARTLERLGPTLITDGHFADTAALDSHVASLRTLARDPNRRDLAWAMGLDSDILDTVTHRSEIRAWMDHLVIPYRRERGRD